MVPFTEQARKHWKRQGWEMGSGMGYILVWNEDKTTQLKFLESILWGGGCVELQKAKAQLWVNAYPELGGSLQTV